MRFNTEFYSNHSHLRQTRFGDMAPKNLRWRQTHFGEKSKVALLLL